MDERSLARSSTRFADSVDRKHEREQIDWTDKDAVDQMRICLRVEQSAKRVGGIEREVAMTEWLARVGLGCLTTKIRCPRTLCCLYSIASISLYTELQTFGQQGIIPVYEAVTVSLQYMRVWIGLDECIG